MTDTAPGPRGFGKGAGGLAPGVMSACDVAAPGEGALKVFWIDLDAPFADEGVLWLEAYEQDRARRFVFERDRRRFLAGRIAARIALGELCARPPDRLAIAQDARGKPFVRGEAAPAFSFSRSGRLAVLAAAWGAVRLGVDLEVCAPIAEAAAVASEQFSEAERERLEGVPPGLRTAGFYRVWTCKEALVKATGEGLGAPLPAITVEADPRRPHRLVSGPAPYAPGSWRLHGLDGPEPDVVAVLAVADSRNAPRADMRQAPKEC